MKRFQIHLTKTVAAEITVEAESERMARNYAHSLPHDALNWYTFVTPKIVHVDEVQAVDPDDNPGE